MLTKRLVEKLCIIILLVFVIPITGCTQKKQTNTETNSGKVQEEERSEDGAEKEAEEAELSVEGVYKYSEDRAWIKLEGEEGGAGEYACIDKEGNMLFKVDAAKVSGVSSFLNGYAFVETDDAVYEIDSNGKLANEYRIEDNISYKAYAGGQIWREEYISDFEKAGYTYSLCDENGNVMTEFSVNGTEPVNEFRYYGQGIWGYDSYNSNGDMVQMIYSSQEDKWVELNIAGNKSICFFEDTAVMGISYEDADETGYGARMYLMDINGNVEEVGIPAELGGNWGDNQYISEGICVLEDYENRLVSYSLESGEFNVMDNEYAEAVRMEALSDKLMFFDGSIALPLLGEDQENYVGLFDTSWNMIGEPIPCLKFDYSEGRLIVMQEDQKEGSEGTYRKFEVYDSKGNFIFQSDDKEYKVITSYKNNTACVLTDEADAMASTAFAQFLNLVTPDDISETDLLASDWKYIDEKGELLFEKINVDDTKEIILS